MKTFLFAFAFVIVVAVAQAQPFLVCASYPNTGPQPTSFTITGLGANPVTAPAVTNPDGSVQLHYDLSTLSPGKYSVTMTASNQWGVSAASGPFVFVSGAPAAPTSVGISTN